MRMLPYSAAAGLLVALLAGTSLAADVITPSPAAAAAAAAPSESPVDYSSPKAAAKSFLNAVRTGNGTAMRDAVVTPPEQQAAVDTLLSILISGANLQKAAADQFGSEGTKAFGNVSSPAVEARLKAVDAAELKATGDSATLTLTADPATQQSGGTIVLKKTGDAWKLDGVSLFGLATTPAAQTAARLQLAKGLNLINEQVTRDIKAGKYLSAADAYQDYWTRSRLATPGAATAPASPPRSE